MAVVGWRHGGSSRVITCQNPKPQSATAQHSQLASVLNIVQLSELLRAIYVPHDGETTHIPQSPA